jgi:hypothetical protein
MLRGALRGGLGLPFLGQRRHTLSSLGVLLLGEAFPRSRRSQARPPGSEQNVLEKIVGMKRNITGAFSAMSMERLADALIALRCGTHSLGLVYEFLLKTCGSPKQARADFVRFLSGELTPRLLEEAQFWVAEEQGREAPTLIDEADLVEFPANSSIVPQAQSNSQYVPIQAG